MNIDNKLFFTIEGGEGSGKSTVIEKIYKRLLFDNVKVIKTREPGGSEIAEQIRAVILNKQNTKMDGKTECLLYAASRRQHLVETIIPALKMGKVVICDRYIDSSLVYQGYAREIGIDEVYNINLFATDSLLPNKVFILDLDPKIGLERISKNKQREINRLDLESLTFHNKVREGYKLLASKNNKQYVVIDASKDVDFVVDSIYNEIKKYI